jgi:hypothetical protein
MGEATTGLNENHKNVPVFSGYAGMHGIREYGYRNS